MAAAAAPAPKTDDAKTNPFRLKPWPTDSATPAMDLVVAVLSATTPLGTAAAAAAAAVTSSSDAAAAAAATTADGAAAAASPAGAAAPAAAGAGGGVGVGYRCLRMCNALNEAHGLPGFRDGGSVGDVTAPVPALIGNVTTTTHVRYNPPVPLIDVQPSAVVLLYACDDRSSFEALRPRFDDAIASQLRVGLPAVVRRVPVIVFVGTKVDRIQPQPQPDPTAAADAGAGAAAAAPSSASTAPASADGSGRNGISAAEVRARVTEWLTASTAGAAASSAGAANANANAPYASLPLPDGAVAVAVLETSAKTGHNVAHFLSLPVRMSLRFRDDWDVPVLPRSALVTVAQTDAAAGGGAADAKAGCCVVS